MTGVQTCALPIFPKATTPVKSESKPAEKTIKVAGGANPNAPKLEAMQKAIAASVKSGGLGGGDTALEAAGLQDLFAGAQAEKRVEGRLGHVGGVLRTQ